MYFLQARRHWSSSISVCVCEDNPVIKVEIVTKSRFEIWSIFSPSHFLSTFQFRSWAESSNFCRQVSTDIQFIFLKAVVFTLVSKRDGVWRRDEKKRRENRKLYAGIKLKLLRMYKMKEPHPPQTHSSSSPPTSSFPPYRPHIEMMRRSAHKRLLVRALERLRVVSQPLSLIQSRVHSWNNLSANHRPRQPFDLTSFCRLVKFPPLFYRSSYRQSMITVLFWPAGFGQRNVLCVESKADGHTRLYGYTETQVIPFLEGTTKNCCTDETLKISSNE